MFAIYLYASPYIALHGIKTAVEQKDADKLSGYIDFPSVKQSIKDQVKAFMVQEIATGEEESGLEALGVMLAAAMIDPIVDSTITPDGVALLFQGQEPDFGLDDDAAPDSSEAPDDDIDYQTNYLSFNRFKVQISNANDVNHSIDVIMHRDWLSWKVTRITFPLGANNKSDNNLEDTMAAGLVTADENAGIDTDDIDIYESDELDTVLQDLHAAQSYEAYDMDSAASDAIETTEALTPAQAAYIDYLADNDIEVSQDMIDSLNDFTLGGGTEADLRQFVIERSGYEDGYRALEDCRNPDMTEAQFVSNCTQQKG